MRKRPLQDIVAPPQRPLRPRVPPRYLSRTDPPAREDFHGARARDGAGGGSGFSLWIVAAVSVVILGFALSLLFSGARVTVIPKQQEVSVNGNFTAFAEALPGELSYEVMTIEKEGSQTVTSTGKELAEERASGVIVVYNNFSQQDQRLIKNTRFESPDGRVYRIRDSIVVPGQNIENGEVVPGSVEVIVYADEPGEAYNAPLLANFTLPGFKGSPQFDGFYAGAKTPMTGGFTGSRLTVDENSLRAVQEEIESELRQTILADAFSQKPEGFELYEDSVFIVFEPLPQKEEGESVIIREKGILYGVLFEESNLAEYIAMNTVAGFDGSDVKIQNAKELSVNVSQGENIQPWEEESITLSISGNAKIVWLFNEEKLKQDLAGREKDAIPTILSGYTSIHSIEASLWPFWRSSFPEDVDKISIKQTLERP